jgi:DNA-binding NarL/FixJ family response regulator
LAEALRTHFPAGRIILLTAWEDTHAWNRAKALGLGGLLLKKAGDQSLQQAVRDVASGKETFLPDLPVPEAVQRRTRWEDLTSTEWAVIRALEKHRTPKAVASQPGSPWVAKTVSSHLQSIYGKLNVRGSPHVIALYHAQGVIVDPSRKGMRTDRPAVLGCLPAPQAFGWRMGSVAAAALL